jgi:hypothetical protein
MNTKTEPLEKNLGPEWDEALLSLLRKVVGDLGGEMRETSWAVGGSQEVIGYEILLREVTLTATAETYVGLLLRGPRLAVEEIAGLLARSRGGDA